MGELKPTSAYEQFQMLETVTRERDALRRALEVIAVGDSKNPMVDAADELVALGFWRAEAVQEMRRSLFESGGSAASSEVTVPAAVPADLKGVALYGIAWRNHLGVEIIVNPEDPRASKGTPVYTLTAALAATHPKEQTTEGGEQR